MKKVLAIDMGATSIRGILGYIENGNLVTEEVMRMSHKIIKNGDLMQWQWEKLLTKIKDTILEYADEISSVGIDTWGVDFGCLDKEGILIRPPMAYREPKYVRGYEAAIRKMQEEDIFLNTGNQIMNINTLFQILFFREHKIQEWKEVTSILMMPDLIQYMLTGEKVGEETIWSTSQILDLQKADFSEEILAQMGLDRALFPKIVKAGEITGSTRESRMEELRKYDIDVISVCGHDTASAVLLTEAFHDEETMFLSCGTWSLIGGIVPRPIITKEVHSRSLTNELGYDSKSMFFKNITGLYLIEKWKEQLEKSMGRELGFDEITEHVKNTKQRVGLIDVKEDVFAGENIDVKRAIDDYLEATGQKSVNKDMDYFKVIYESLVEEYLNTKKAVEEVTGKTYKKLHMIGGGAKSAYLCQLIADKLQLPVIAGPYEATALGNILVQLRTVGEIESVEEGLDLVKKAEEVNTYEPSIRFRDQV